MCCVLKEIYTDSIWQVVLICKFTSAQSDLVILFHCNGVSPEFSVFEKLQGKHAIHISKGVFNQKALTCTAITKNSSIIGFEMIIGKRKKTMQKGNFKKLPKISAHFACFYTSRAFCMTYIQGKNPSCFTTRIHQR